MARVKTYKIDEIIKLLNEYRFENSGAKVTIPKFGEYIRDKGYAIEDHTLRRDDEFRAYLNKINEDDENRLLNGVVTYRTRRRCVSRQKQLTKQIKRSINNTRSLLCQHCG